MTSDLPLSVGDTVALHWGSVCDVLSDRQLAWLRHVTAARSSQPSVATDGDADKALS